MQIQKSSTSFAHKKNNSLGWTNKTNDYCHFLCMIWETIYCEIKMLEGSIHVMFFFWRTRAKFHPQLGRCNPHNKSLELQIARHCYWIRFNVPGCIQWQRNFCQIFIA
jgi:hypothetical protein